MDLNNLILFSGLTVVILQNVAEKDIISMMLEVRRYEQSGPGYIDLFTNIWYNEFIEDEFS